MDLGATQEPEPCAASACTRSDADTEWLAVERLSVGVIAGLEPQDEWLSKADDGGRSCLEMIWSIIMMHEANLLPVVFGHGFGNNYLMETGAVLLSE